MTDKITLIEGLFRNQYVCISELLDLKNKIETPYGYICLLYTSPSPRD